MQLPDLVTRTIASHPHPLLFVTISGAHLYGFASSDSDWDVRGVHVLPLRDVAGLVRGEETFEVMLDGPPEVDVVTHDAGKFFAMLLKRNGYVLEQLCSPLIAHTTGEHEELLALVPRIVTRHHGHHYFGFAARQWDLFDKERPRRIKPLLYVFRALMTGIHLMRHGQIEANLPRLNDVFRMTYIDELIAQKTSGVEHEPVDDRDVELFRREYERFVILLEDEVARTSLPDQTPARAELHDLLLRIRAV